MMWLFDLILFWPCAGFSSVLLKIIGKASPAVGNSRRARLHMQYISVYRTIKYLWEYKIHKHIYAQRRFLGLLLGVQVFKIALKLDLVQVYAPSNDSEYREYTEWFLSINTASGGDR